MTNSVAVAQSNLSFCGPYTITWSPALPSFMTFADPIITLTSSNPADVATYPNPITMTVTYKLTNYSSITSVSKTFTVQVVCKVQTMVFATSPLASKTIEPGVTI